jgi:hypothetical protein
MANLFIDPYEEAKQGIARIRNTPVIDDKEMKDREEAAGAYSNENQQHFVDYCMDCVATSVAAMKEVREIQDECWRMYQEDEPPNYADKEDWQSRVVLPKPYGSVLYAKAITRKAFDTEFLSIDDRFRGDYSDADVALWQQILDLQLSRRFGKFSLQFSDATEMAFAVGTSMEMIPIWKPKKGLRFSLVEPWKIHRDPDALSRDPQSGMYWVHQEWMDWWTLKQFEKKKRYENVPARPMVSSDSSTDGATATDRNEKRNFMEHRGKFRSMVPVYEFWGVVLGPDGNMLLPNHTYTITPGQSLVLQRPKPSPYHHLRWPGISFSPLPHLLRHDGRSLLQGIKTLWYFMCSLLTLYNDNLNWIVNPPTEIDVSALVEESEVDDMPGKQWLTRGTAHGQPVIRTVDRHSRTNDVLATLQYANQCYEEPPVPSNIIKGLPGFRDRVTARESAQSLQQSMTVYSVMGFNLEDGALSVIDAVKETIAANMTFQELAEWFGMEMATAYYDPQSKTTLRLPDTSTGAFSVSGISSLLKEEEVLRSLSELIFPMSIDPVYQPYFNHYNVVSSIIKRLNLKDEGIVVDPQMAQGVGAMQQENQMQAIQDEMSQRELGLQQMSNQNVMDVNENTYGGEV